MREAWSLVGGIAGFSVDHVEPQSGAPHRICDYDNLVYACLPCNSARQDRPLPDPCAVGLGTLVRLTPDGRMEALTAEGERLILILELNRPGAIATRRTLLDLLARLHRVRKRRDEDLSRWFGYPADLPDLSALRPPDGNSRPGGMVQSHQARRMRGELAATY